MENSADNSEDNSEENLRQHHLEKTRAILRNEKFRAMSPSDRSRILNGLVAKGLALDDLKMLIKEALDGRQTVQNVPSRAYFETLPYDVFFTVVTRGEIAGADLLRLCNSSNTLRDYCNRSRVINGEEHKQFLFRQLLAKMGKQVSLDANARELYKYYVIDVPRMFDSVRLKLKIAGLFYDALKVSEGKVSAGTPYPTNMYNLLYADHILNLFDPVGLPIPDSEAAALNAEFYRKGLAISTWLLLQNNEQYWTDKQYAAIKRHELELLNLARKLYPLHDKLKLLIRRNMELVTKEIRDIVFAGMTYHITARNFIDYINNLEDHGLLDILNKYEYREFVNYVMGLTSPGVTTKINTQITKMFQSMAGAFIDSPDFLKFTDGELEFIVSLHYRILNGELHLRTPFTLEGVIFG